MLFFNISIKGCFFFSKSERLQKVAKSKCELLILFFSCPKEIDILWSIYIYIWRNGFKKTKIWIIFLNSVKNLKKIGVICYIGNNENHILNYECDSDKIWKYQEVLDQQLEKIYANIDMYLQKMKWCWNK